MIGRRGLIYTVEEVSALLGIPRPTLYRYLREYSIPHLRKAGKISIPEDSFSRIREARDLHKEGLGTESVRRALREGGPDSGELKERIERLSASLEDLRGNGSAADEALSSQAMRTVLARQSLIMSAMFNLTDMVEELLLASGKPRKTVFEEVDGEIREVALPRRGERSRTRRSLSAAPDSRAALPSPDALPSRPAGFGSLARRRRRASLVLLAVLLVGVMLVLTLPRLGDGELATLAPSPNDRTGQNPAIEGSEQRQAGATKPEDEAAPSAGDGSPDVDPGVSTGTVETGPGEIPDVSGLEIVEAARKLSMAGYEVAALRTVKSEQEAGTTLRTEPEAGSEAEPGTPVLVVTSGGPSATDAGP